MIKLPFKTSPKEFEKVVVGNAEIGELELPKYGDISPNERIFMKQETANISDPRNTAVKLARTIATKSNQRMIDVYNAFVSGDSKSLGDYLEEFVQFQDLLEESSKQRNLVLATAIIKRLVPDWELENTGDANQIHPQLVQAVADFGRKEESGWQEPEAVSEEEQLGNSTTNTLVQTGAKSTGDVEDTGRKKKDSVAATSETSQPG
ncbi:hypothetical protein LC593_31870 [Nostoc sp. CHAB 5844]|nr:hypothetical protein [Nostoc sp. CHAB 5844]